MNLLEHYIVKVHSIKVIEALELLSSTYVEVELEYNCHGHIGRIKRLFTKDEWDKTVEKGYYLA